MRSLPFMFTVVITLLTGEAIAGNCYQCEWGGSSSSCNNSYEVGGTECTLACGGGYCSCYTGGSCGSGGGGNPCRPKGCQQNLAGREGSASNDRFVVTEEGLGALSRQSALLARLLTALSSRNAGSVYLGSVFNGILWTDGQEKQEGSEGPIGFGGATTLENGVLTVDFKLTGHARLSGVRAEISNGGLAGRVQWTDTEARATEEVW